MNQEWSGETPVFLVVDATGYKPTIIDLDMNRWIDTHHDIITAPGRWYLCNKTNNAVLGGMVINQGEVPYYVARHVGVGSSLPGLDGLAKSNEMIVYGIGKKRIDGHFDRMWFMLNGFVCSGDDVEQFAFQHLQMERQHENR